MKLKTLKLRSSRRASQRMGSRTKFSFRAKGHQASPSRLGDVHPPKTSKEHYPGVETLGIELNGAETPESHCCCTSGSKLLQKERSLANRLRGCAPCPDPNNTVRESTSASDAAGLSRFNNRELDVHRHDDPPLPLSRHAWLTQPVFLYCLCMVLSNSLIDPPHCAECICCARPETPEALPNLQLPLRTQ
jgi:hypothetical protein